MNGAQKTQLASVHVEFCLAWLKFKVSGLLQTFTGIQVINCVLPVLEADQIYKFVSSLQCDISLFDFGQNLHSITSLLLRDRFLNDKQTLTCFIINTQQQMYG